MLNYKIDGVIFGFCEADAKMHPKLEGCTIGATVHLEFNFCVFHYHGTCWPNLETRSPVTKQTGYQLQMRDERRRLMIDKDKRPVEEFFSDLNVGYSLVDTKARYSFEMSTGNFLFSTT